MSAYENQSNAPSSSKMIGTVSAICGFLIAGAVWMYADERTAQTIAGGIASAGMVPVAEATVDPSLPKASEVALPAVDDDAGPPPSI